MVKYVTVVWEVEVRVHVCPDAICAEPSRYLRQPGKACGTLVPASAAARSHSPCVTPVTTQIAGVAFVCWIVRVEE